MCFKVRRYERPLLKEYWQERLRAIFVEDPPYPPLNETAYFTHYTTGRFNRIDQEWLAACVRKADRKGCPFMMTNADTDKIRRLYRGFDFVRIPVTRFVTCEAKRNQVRELVLQTTETA